MASRQTFHHFLRGHQPTFVASYLLLSLAGAIAPSIREAGATWSWLASIVLWGVFSVGVVKVSRHVFWLTEEFHRPRVFGFFPILLLGGQFLAVFAWNFARSFATEWIGFGCVLVAIPVLLTADTVARVFQERTGNLVRPIPWPIILPFTFGLILCVIGVVVAGTAIPQQAPDALVPTAALMACSMVVVARRTNRTAFVWAMLVGVVLAYNFSPVFFQGLARAVVVHGAAAVKESRLPLAFYGLTYLPLILVMSGFAVFLRGLGEKLFAVPLQQFCVAISWVLLAASLGHVKALLPVATVMLVVFAGQAIVFQNQRLALAAIVAFYVAAAGSAPFIARVFSVSVSPPLFYVIPLCATVALLAASPVLDLKIERLALWHDDSRFKLVLLTTSMCRVLSLCGAIFVAVAWTLRFGNPIGGPSAVASVFVVGVLAVHSLVWARPAVSWFAYACAISELARNAIEWDISAIQITYLATVVLLAQWLLI